MQLHNPHCYTKNLLYTTFKNPHQNPPLSQMKYNPKYFVSILKKLVVEIADFWKTILYTQNYIQTLRVQTREFHKDVQEWYWQEWKKKLSVAFFANQSFNKQIIFFKKCFSLVFSQ